jgi:hypothetical protein
VAELNVAASALRLKNRGNIIMIAGVGFLLYLRGSHCPAAALQGSAIKRVFLHGSGAFFTVA